MKRFTSIAFSLLLALTMVVSCITVASAANDATAVDFTQTATLTLTKYETGTKGTNDEEKISGATFTAYRVLDLTESGYSVDTAFQGSGIDVSMLIGEDNTTFTTYGTYGTTTDLEAQITTLQNYVIASNIEGKKLTDNNDGTYTLSTTEFGVYLVRETEAPDDYVVNTQSFLVAIPQWDQESNGGEWDYTIEASPKDQTIDVTKEISDHADNTNKVDKDSYEIGDNIPYTVTAVIPNYGTSTDYTDLTVTHNLALNYKDGNGTADQETGIKMYNNLGLLFTDTLSKGLELNSLGDTSNGLGLTVTVDTTKLTSGASITATDIEGITDTTLTDKQKIYAALQAAGKKLTGATYTGGTYTGTTEGDAQFVYYSVKDTETGITTMYVYVPWCVIDNQDDADGLGNQGDNIVLTYSAYLTADAVQGTGYDNNVTYNYTNDPQTVSSTAYDPQSSDDDKTTTYTYGMELTKKLNGETTDSYDWSNITDVTFELYAGEDTSGDKLTFIKNSDNSYTLVNEDNATALSATETSLNPNSDGKLIIKGLAAGTYQLKETKTVDGYSLLTAPVEIVVKEKDGAIAEVTAKVQDSDSNTIETLQTKAEADNEETDANKATFVLTVNNSADQFNLPFTGGMGLWIFTITGGLIMGAAIIVLVVNRKRKASK